MRNDSFLANIITARAVQAKINLYSSMDSNVMPLCMTGSVNSGINPKQAEESSPKRKPLVLFDLIISHILMSAKIRDNFYGYIKLLEVTLEFSFNLEIL
jgi:hypothetical protein